MRFPRKVSFFWGQLPHSFQGSFFLETRQKLWGNGWFFKMTMAEKNGEGTPRNLIDTFSGKLSRKAEIMSLGKHYQPWRPFFPSSNHRVCLCLRVERPKEQQRAFCGLQPQHQQLLWNSGPKPSGLETSNSGVPGVRFPASATSTCWGKGASSDSEIWRTDTDPTALRCAKNPRAANGRRVLKKSPSPWGTNALRFLVKTNQGDIPSEKEEKKHQQTGEMFFLSACAAHDLTGKMGLASALGFLGFV